MVDEAKSIALPKGYKLSEVISHPFIAGKLYMKKMTVPKGMFVQTHIHKYDHYSILAKGQAILLKGQQEIDAFVQDGKLEGEDITAGEEILVKAHTPHAVVFTDDSVWFCIHVTDTEHEDIDKELVVDELR